MEKSLPPKSKKTYSAVLVLCVLLAVTIFTCETKKPVVSDTEPPPAKPVSGPVQAGPVTNEPGAPLVEMVLVSGGTFNMGTPRPRTGFEGEGIVWPRHTVTLRDFYMGKYEITQGLYYDVTRMNPSENNKNPDNPARDGWRTLPVEYITWYDAIIFCNKLSVRENLTPAYSLKDSVDTEEWGEPPTRRSSAWEAMKVDMKANGYRLPTEAEWEYSARGGAESKGYIYSGSNTIGDVAWYTGINADKTAGAVHGVGKKQPNEIGLHDMSGNVMEWCWDWEGNYPSAAQDNPLGPASGTHRVIRGGSWSTRHTFCMSLSRQSNLPHYTGINLGLRVARSK